MPARPFCLPLSERRRHPGSQRFRGSMAGLYAPLPTLRRRPRGRLRKARGRCGSLLLHRSGLSPHTPCRSPGALTRVAARTLALSPICDPLHRRLQPFRHLHDCSGCFRLERSPGGALTHWKAPPCHGARKSRSFPDGVSNGSSRPEADLPIGRRREQRGWRRAFACRGATPSAVLWWNLRGMFHLSLRPALRRNLPAASMVQPF